jgi:hypothetical protein
VIRYRHFLIACLLLALPLQGAIASSRWLCAPMSPASTANASPVDHAVHGHATSLPHGHVAAPGMAELALHVHGSTSHDERTPDTPDAGCKLCAACTVTAATPPATIVLGAVERAGAPFPAVAVPVPRIVADGLERPPRT